MAEMPEKGEKNGDGDYKTKSHSDDSRSQRDYDRKDKEKVRSNEGDKDGDLERDRDRHRDKSDRTKRETSRDDGHSHPTQDYDSKRDSGFDMVPPAGAAVKKQRMERSKNNNRRKENSKKLLAKLREVRENEDFPWDVSKPKEKSYNSTMTKEELDNFVVEVCEGEGDDLL